MTTKLPSRRLAFRIANLEPHLKLFEQVLDTVDRHKPMPKLAAGWSRRLLGHHQRLLGMPETLPAPDDKPFEYFRAMIVVFDRRRRLIRQHKHAHRMLDGKTYPRTSRAAVE